MASRIFSEACFSSFDPGRVRSLFSKSFFKLFSGLSLGVVVDFLTFDCLTILDINHHIGATALFQRLISALGLPSRSDSLRGHACSSSVNPQQNRLTQGGLHIKWRGFGMARGKSRKERRSVYDIERIGILCNSVSACCDTGLGSGIERARCNARHSSNLASPACTKKSLSGSAGSRD